MNAELIDFSRQALAKGIGRQDIATTLRQAGWSEADARAALGAFADVPFPLPVPRPKPYPQAQDAFVYLVLFLALYVSAYNLCGIAFKFIDRAIPDPLLRLGLGYDFGAAVRWNVATLIVTFPLFLFVFRLVNRTVARDPVKRGSQVRKWLTYLTLFVAAAMLTGDLVGLIYNVLSGEFTVRFALKVATVGIVAGGSFIYFLADVRAENEA
jgi:hypothetical protein